TADLDLLANREEGLRTGDGRVVDGGEEGGAGDGGGDAAGVNERGGRDRRTLAGDIAAGVQGAGEADRPRRLGAAGPADREVQGRKLAGDDVEVLIDAEAHDPLAGDGDEVVGAVLAERARTGVELVGAALGDEEAVAFDGEVARVAGRRERAG